MGPWGTFVKGTVTYALRGNLDRYNNRWGVYLLVFKAARLMARHAGPVTARRRPTRS